MKSLNLLSGLLFSALLLFSCTKNDNEETIRIIPKEDPGWGYFYGEINGKKIKLNNDFYEGFISSGRLGIYEPGEQSDSINSIGTVISIDTISQLRIFLYKLKLGERHIKFPVSYERYESSINLSVYTDLDYSVVNYRYIPSVENQFRVEIVDVIWESMWHPVIEVKLDGVLYNENDSNDAIVINGIYGTR